MQNVLLPGAVVLLTVVLWLRRKPVKPMLSSTDASRVAQINRAQLELVIVPAAAAESLLSPCGQTPKSIKKAVPLAGACSGPHF